jgi:glutathione peroxidase
MNEFYKYEVENHKGESVKLEDYKGKVVLVVNTASKCGFTPQYAGLQELYETYNERGLEILAFPCNQFGQQESGSNDDIQKFCQFNYGLTFPVFGKLEVNGANEHPLYTYLKSEKKGLVGRNIKWNFTKFLIDRQGNVIKRFAPTIKPLKMINDIENLIIR